MADLMSVTRLAALVGTILLATQGLAAWDASKPWTRPDPPPLAAPWHKIDTEATLTKQGGPTVEDQVMEIVNQKRWDNGQLPPLKRQSLLDNSSETHSFNMGDRDFFAHCDLDTGDLPVDRIADAGYWPFSAAGENIAAGYSSAAEVMTAWMNSPGHRANILSSNYKELGIGYVLDAADTGDVRLDQDSNCVADSFDQGPFFHYWTQNFGARSSFDPVVIDREAYLTTDRNVDLYLYGESWATQMRLRNAGGSWTAWQAFTSNVAWQLSPGDDVKQVDVEMTNGSTTRSASDTIVLEDTTGSLFSDGFETGDCRNWTESP